MRPQGDEAEEATELIVLVAGLDQDAVAVERVAEPAERHREATLVAAVAAPRGGGVAQRWKSDRLIDECRLTWVV